MSAQGDAVPTAAKVLADLILLLFATFGAGIVFGLFLDQMVRR